MVQCQFPLTTSRMIGPAPLPWMHPRGYMSLVWKVTTHAGQRETLSSSLTFYIPVKYRSIIILNYSIHNIIIMERCMLRTAGTNLSSPYEPWFCITLFCAIWTILRMCIGDRNPRIKSDAGACMVDQKPEYHLEWPYPYTTTLLWFYIYSCQQPRVSMHFSALINYLILSSWCLEMVERYHVAIYWLCPADFREKVNVKDVCHDCVQRYSWRLFNAMFCMTYIYCPIFDCIGSVRCVINLWCDYIIRCHIHKCGSPVNWMCAYNPSK